MGGFMGVMQSMLGGNPNSAVKQNKAIQAQQAEQEKQNQYRQAQQWDMDTLQHLTSQGALFGDPHTGLVKDHHRANRAFDQRRKGEFQVLDGAVMIEVIGLHVEHSQGEGRQLGEGPKALVDFKDEVTRSPMSIGADAQHRRTEQAGVVSTRGARDVHHHRGRRGLSVRAREPDDAQARREFAEQLASTEQARTSSTRARNLYVVLGHRRRPEYDLGFTTLGLVVATKDANAHRLEFDERH